MHSKVGRKKDGRVIGVWNRLPSLLCGIVLDRVYRAGRPVVFGRLVVCRSVKR